MAFPKDQIEELKKLFLKVQLCEEGGATFFLIPALTLPDHCKPTVADALLCPTPRDGYKSRLFFSEKIQVSKPPNWNATIRIVERNWFAYSWETTDGLRLAQMIPEHLRGLRQ